MAAPAGRLTYVGLIVVVFVLAAGDHYPVFVTDISSPERAHRVEDIDRSEAFYGRLDPGDVDYYGFTADADQEVAFEVLVPKRSELRGYRPQVYVMGPGIGGSCAPELEVPGNAGCEPVVQRTAPVDFHEAFTQTLYWSYTAERGASTVRLPETGEYLFAVTVDQGDGGPYAVATGERESLSPLDALAFPFEWVRVHLWYFT